MITGDVQPDADRAVVEVTNVSPHGIWLLARGAERFLAYADFPECIPSCSLPHSLGSPVELQSKELAKRYFHVTAAPFPDASFTLPDATALVALSAGVVLLNDLT
jgi:hypothetical protein